MEGSEAPTPAPTPLAKVDQMSAIKLLLSEAQAEENEEADEEDETTTPAEVPCAGERGRS